MEDWLFSQMKTMGSFHRPARERPSWKAPWVEEAAHLSLRVRLGRGLLDAADDQHLAVELAEELDVGLRLPAVLPGVGLGRGAVSAAAASTGRRWALWSVHGAELYPHRRLLA